MQLVKEINYPYDENQFINKLPAYDCNSGVDSLLDLLREIQFGGNYYYQGLVFPNLVSYPRIPAQGTLNGTQIVPPGSYVTAFSVYSEMGADFSLKIYDKGSKASIYYPDYALGQTVGGIFTTTPDVPSGPAFIKSPFIITGPGVLGWEIVNRSTEDNRIQVLIDCAIPVNSRSIGNMVVNRG